MLTDGRTDVRTEERTNGRKTRSLYHAMPEQARQKERSAEAKYIVISVHSFNR